MLGDIQQVRYKGSVDDMLSLQKLKNVNTGDSYFVERLFTVYTWLGTITGWVPVSTVPFTSGKYIVFDIDGVVANPEKRVHFIQEKNWDAFYAHCDEDDPIAANMELLRLFLCSPKYEVVFITGRPERIRDKTCDWFYNHGSDIYSHKLLMRKEGDYRQDYVIKEELAESLGFENILWVYEDRDQVVNMWRAHGVQCYQTCKGTY